MINITNDRWLTTNIKSACHSLADDITMTGNNR